MPMLLRSYCKNCLQLQFGKLLNFFELKTDVDSEAEIYIQGLICTRELDNTLLVVMNKVFSGRKTVETV
ncbi:hypothetical protein MHYP_G00258590 [Metynnis hypsauchen]